MLFLNILTPKETSSVYCPISSNVIQLDWKLDLFVQLNAYWKHIWKKSVAVSEEKSGNLCCHCEGNGRKCYLSVQIYSISVYYYRFCSVMKVSTNVSKRLTPKADDNCFITSESNGVLSNMFWLKGDTHVGTHLTTAKPILV